MYNRLAAAYQCHTIFTVTEIEVTKKYVTNTMPAPLEVI